MNTLNNKEKASASHWASIDEHTSVSGIKFLFWIYKILGRIPFRIFLYPVVLYYWATRPSARRASLDYLSKLQSFNGSLGHHPSWKDTIGHFISFAETILDKLLAMTGGISVRETRIVGITSLDQMRENGRGAVIVTAHVGCLELCRITAENHPNAKLNVLVHTKHAQRFNRLLRRLRPESEVNLIQVTEVTPATAMMLANKVDNGEFLAIAGDRIPVSNGRTVTSSFLGNRCELPVGPYVLASLLKCPLFAICCVRGASDAEYVVQIQHLVSRVELPRNGREKALHVYAQQFANWLEVVVSASPYSWFNFFEFWSQGLSQVYTKSKDRNDEY